MENKAIHAIIRGDVQGVCFRYEARLLATSLGLTGWVRNLPDGSVETYAEGQASAVDRYLKWLHKGPPIAHVTSVDVTEKPYSGSYTSFTVKF